MPLTDTAIRNAKPGITPAGKVTDKPCKMGDAGGLYLEVSPTGGKEKRLSLGVYLDESLKDARQRRDDARKLLANNIDPAENRKAVKASQVERAGNSFEIIAREWFAKQSVIWTENHGSRIIQRLERDISPWIDGHPIAEITASAMPLPPDELNAPLPRPQGRIAPSEAKPPCRDHRPEEDRRYATTRHFLIPVDKRTFVL